MKKYKQVKCLTVEYWGALNTDVEEYSVILKDIHDTLKHEKIMLQDSIFCMINVTEILLKKTSIWI